jgi:hypothetical protein
MTSMKNRRKFLKISKKLQYFQSFSTNFTKIFAAPPPPHPQFFGPRDTPVYTYIIDGRSCNSLEENDPDQKIGQDGTSVR